MDYTHKLESIGWGSDVPPNRWNNVTPNVARCTTYIWLQFNPCTIIEFNCNWFSVSQCKAKHRTNSLIRMRISCFDYIIKKMCWPLCVSATRCSMQVSICWILQLAQHVSVHRMPIETLINNNNNSFFFFVPRHRSSSWYFIVQSSHSVVISGGRCQSR